MQHTSHKYVLILITSFSLNAMHPQQLVPSLPKVTKQQALICAGVCATGGLLWALNRHYANIPHNQTDAERLEQNTAKLKHLVSVVGSAVTNGTSQDLCSLAKQDFQVLAGKHALPPEQLRQFHNWLVYLGHAQKSASLQELYNTRCSHDEKCPLNFLGESTPDAISNTMAQVIGDLNKHMSQASVPDAEKVSSARTFLLSAFHNEFQKIQQIV